MVPMGMHQHGSTDQQVTALLFWLQLLGIMALRQAWETALTWIVFTSIFFLSLHQQYLHQDQF